MSSWIYQNSKLSMANSDSIILYYIWTRPKIQKHQHSLDLFVLDNYYCLSFMINLFAHSKRKKKVVICFCIFRNCFRGSTDMCITVCWYAGSANKYYASMCSIIYTQYYYAETRITQGTSHCL